jgi:peptidoglycan hydrolase-like protein with peptidoglycan-binding domain
VTCSSSARHALQTALALVALLLTHSAAAAQDPRADGARPTPSNYGRGQQVESSSARFSHARLAGDRAIGGSHARPVGFGAGFDRDCGSDRVREIQRRLRGLGYRLGPVDGLFGPRTRNAVRLLQYTLGVRPTGVVSPKTLALLRERSPLRARAVRVGSGRAGTCGSARVRSVQRRLRTLGYRPGPVDGWFGSRTRAAVVRFQRDYGLEADGSIAPVTILAALRRESSQERGVRQRVREPAAPPARERLASASPGASVQALADDGDLPRGFASRRRMPPGAPPKSATASRSNRGAANGSTGYGRWTPSAAAGCATSSRSSALAGAYRWGALPRNWVYSLGP